MNIPTSSSQLQIPTRYAKPEECSPQIRHKSVVGKYICEVGKQEIEENLYTPSSAYWACPPVGFII